MPDGRIEVHPPRLPSARRADMLAVTLPFAPVLDGESPYRGYHLDHHRSKSGQPIFSTQPRGFRALLRRAPRSALTVLVIAAISGCTPGGGGVTPSAPPSPEGQAILAWGGNSSGQLGDNSNNQRLNPVTVPGRPGSRRCARTPAWRPGPESRRSSR